jgi:hypothetical protein
MQATNNDLKARCTVSATNDENFSFTADPKILEKLISKIDLDEIRMSFDPKDFILKVYTTGSDKSFNSLQSFPPDRMLTFDSTPKPDRKQYPINKEVLLFALNYAKSFLAGPKDDQKQFDFVVINKGIVYSANGSNKMGLIVFKLFANIENFKIRKLTLPLMISFVECVGTEEVVLIDTDKDTGFESADGSMHFSCLKSNVDPPDIPRGYMKSEGAYTKINKDSLLKVIDRLTVSSASTASSGVELILTGAKENAVLSINLVSTLKVTESFPCERVDDDSEEDVSHVVDYKIFKSVLGSFDTDTEVRLHINDGSKFYKVYSSGEMAGNKYILAGIGSYAKIVRQ